MICSYKCEYCFVSDEVVMGQGNGAWINTSAHKIRKFYEGTEKQLAFIDLCNPHTQAIFNTVNNESLLFCY